MKINYRNILRLAPLVAVLSVSLSYAAETKEYAVQASAMVQLAPPVITLEWPTNSATGYDVYRRDYDTGGSWGSALTNLSGVATNFQDTNVTAGVLYEYKITKLGTPIGHGYLCAGIEVPLIEDRGKLILLVEDTYTLSLSNELLRLELDLAGDGWSVIRQDVSPSESVTNIKSIIQAAYTNDPVNTKALLLFGHIPVPYSGDLAPDGHPDHAGAWPADAYYADMDGSWTDTSINTTNATLPRHHNVPGDGKFDSSGFVNVELQVGRVDLSDMPAFTTNTLALLRQYLDKDHEFRHRITDAPRRALIDDHFGEFGGEAFAATGWRSGSAFFGSTNVAELDWLTTLNSNVYLFAYGCGGGTYTSCGGVGTTSQFSSNDPKSVFNALFGSYFGDWDSQDNLLRAPLCTSRGLTSYWAGRPHWFAHPMAMGRTMGEVARLSQNNTGIEYAEAGFNTRRVHIALMGDPTLRLHPVAPVSNLTTIGQAGSIDVRWYPSPDINVTGYHVYRSTAPAGPFSRLNGALLQGTNYTDNAAPGGDLVYMVRAVKLEVSASGTYYNPSQGILWSHHRDYSDWRFNHFRYAGSEGAPDADPDGDGVPNAMEFHYGTDPNSGNHPHHPPVIVNVESNNAYMEYTRNWLIPDSNITYYISEDLSSSWTPATEGIHFEVLSEVTNANANVTANLRFYNATNKVLFIRTEIDN